MPRVLLIVMPFYSASEPPLAPSLLKPLLEREKISCDISYFNMIFASRIGSGLFEEICRHKSDGGEDLIGERIFAEELFGKLLPDREQYRQHLYDTYPATVARHTEKFLAAQSEVKSFLEHCLESTEWEHYDLIGFSSMFDQNLASLALATRIKEHFPDKPIVFGGANCDGEMGIELHRRFPCIDYVCCGEADYSFPALVQRLHQGAPIDDLPGVVRRTPEGSQLTGPPLACDDLDALPFPDYDDYFNQLQRSQLPSCGTLGMETSRGCWWGARRQCRFCGLNPDFIRFREKSAARVLTELEQIIERYCRPHDIRSIVMADNVLSLSYFSYLMPELARRKYPVRLFYEVKANISREQLRLLSEAGVDWVQPGIESLSSNVLRLMSKGIDALHNVQFLKNCALQGIKPVWNLINGIPGETENDYRRMLDLIEKLHHLQPPAGYSRFELQRFSPFFNDPGRYLIHNVRPKKVYRYLYPFKDPNAANLAYHFDFDYSEEVEPYLESQLKKAIVRWQKNADRGEDVRMMEEGPSVLIIEDNRGGAAFPEIRLEGVHKEIYQFCDEVRSFASIMIRVREDHKEMSVRPRDLREFLREMISANLMAGDNDLYLSLASLKQGY